MFRTVYASKDVPVHDRLRLLDRLVTTNGCPMRAFSKDAARFSARLDSLDLADVNVVQLTCSPTDVIRTRRHVRNFDPELWCLVVPRAGRLLLEQAGQMATVEEGNLALYTSSQPFRIHIEAPGQDAASLLQVQVPMGLFQLPASRLDRMLAQPVTGTSGVGALFTAYLNQLAVDSGSFKLTDLPRLGNLLADLMTATLSHQLEAQTPSALAEATLMPSITEFIRDNLGDPDLSPPAIAAAHHISVSYLHRLFRSQDTTVGTWIRSRRLEQARRDLGDHQLGNVPIHRIAARWGFGDHATFTRAFRARFGITPRDYRDAAGPSSGALTG